MFGDEFEGRAQLAIAPQRRCKSCLFRQLFEIAHVVLAPHLGLKMDFFKTRGECLYDPSTLTYIQPYLEDPAILPTSDIPHALVCTYEALARLKKRHPSIEKLRIAADPDSRTFKSRNQSPECTPPACRPPDRIRTNPDPKSLTRENTSSECKPPERVGQVHIHIRNRYIEKVNPQNVNAPNV